MLAPTLLVMSLAAALADVAHILRNEGETRHTTTEAAPHRPYVFSYTAGRYPGHSDRYHAEVSDGSGVITGTFSYVDPRQHVRTVDYVADKDGFHPVLSDPLPAHPRETAAVAAATHKHHQLYAEIAEDHANNPHPRVAASSLPRQSAAVEAAAARHADLFRVIAEQHARIAAERDLLQQQDLAHELDEHEHDQPHDLQHLQH